MMLQSAGKCLPFLPSHMLHTSATTTAKFSEHYDKVHKECYVVIAAPLPLSMLGGICLALGSIDMSMMYLRVVG